MVFSGEDKPLIKNLHLIKGYGQRKLMSKFPDKNWKLSSLIKLLKIWGIVQQRVYQSRVHNVSELKQRLLLVRHGTDQTIIAVAQYTDK